MAQKKNKPLAGADLRRTINSYYKEKGGQWTAKYRKNIQADLNNLLSYLGKKQFTRENCQDSINEFRGRWLPSTLRQYRKNIVGLVIYLRKYKDNKYYDWNGLLETPKVPKVDIPRLGPDLMVKIIIAGTEPGPGDYSRNRAIKIETRAALLFQLYQGLRVNEVLWIKGEDIHLKAKIPEFRTKRKGGDEKLLVLSGLSLDDTRINLEERAKRSGTKAFMAGEKTMNVALKRGLKRLQKQGVTINFPEKEMRTHYLRKTCATDLADNGASVHTMTDYMGHSDPKITYDSYYLGNLDSQNRMLRTKQTMMKKKLKNNEKLELLMGSLRELGLEQNICTKINEGGQPESITITFLDN